MYTGGLQETLSTVIKLSPNKRVKYPDDTEDCNGIDEVERVQILLLD